MRFIILLFSILLITGCAQKAEWHLVSVNQKSEISRTHEDIDEKRSILVAEISCPGRFNFPISSKVEVRDTQGNVLPDVTIGIGYSDIPKEKKRDIFFFFRDTDLARYNMPIFNAVISSKDFPDITIQHQFTEKKNGG